MVTCRVGRSTSFPARASLYSRWPSTQTAEYIGGSWSMVPRSGARAASSAFFVTGFSLVERILPVQSWVSVVTPKRMEAV